MDTRWVIYNNQPYYLFGMTKHIYRLMDINHNYIDIPTNEPLDHINHQHILLAKQYYIRSLIL